MLWIKEERSVMSARVTGRWCEGAPVMSGGGKGAPLGGPRAAEALGHRHRFRLHFGQGSGGGTWTRGRMECFGIGFGCAVPQVGCASGAASQGARLGRCVESGMEVGARWVEVLEAAAALACAMRARISAGVGVAVCGDRDLLFVGGYGGGVGVRRGGRARVAGAAGKQGA
jgi:hypothetical protein